MGAGSGAAAEHTRAQTRRYPAPGNTVCLWGQAGSHAMYAHCGSAPATKQLGSGLWSSSGSISSICVARMCAHSIKMECQAVTRHQQSAQEHTWLRADCSKSPRYGCPVCLLASQGQHQSPPSPVHAAPATSVPVGHPWGSLDGWCTPGAARRPGCRSPPSGRALQRQGMSACAGWDTHQHDAWQYYTHMYI